MYTDKDTLLKITNYALHKATEDWSEESKRALSKEAFQVIVEKQYKEQIEIPTMKPQVIIQ